MFSGIALAAVSGVFNGLCLLPMRYMKAFAWENTWFVWCLFGCVVFPSAIAYLTIPSLGQVFTDIGLLPNTVMLVVGLVAGMSGICFGLGLARVGMTLANSLTSGMSLAVGSFVPLLIQHREAIASETGLVLMSGLFLAITGVCACAWAGAQTDRESPYMSATAATGKTRPQLILQGIFLSVMAGMLTPLMNLGLAFGDTFTQAAERHGSSQVFMSFAVYIPYLGASFISNAAYCAFLWRQHQTYHQFFGKQGAQFTGIAVAMAAFWVVSIVLYGWAMPWMDNYGPVIGWPVSLAAASMSAAVVEILYGDWKGKSLLFLLVGLGLLLVSIVTFVYSSILIQGTSPSH